ncbi:MAG: homocysteine S-methyltransferase family protein, partial [Victivallaceae bacterium]
GVVFFDGDVGSELYNLGFLVIVSYENLSLAAPDKVKAIHTAYLDAGADVITTNSYAANRQSLSRYGLADKVREINVAAVKLAQDAIAESKRTALIAGSVSSLNHNESIDPATALEIIQEQALALIDGGCDFLMFETTPTHFDAEIALQVAAACKFPAIVSFAVNAKLELADHTKLSDIYPELLRNQFIVAWGLNCIIGPEQMLEAAESALKIGSLPLLVQPNSGAPREIDHRMLNMCSPEYFTTYALR